MVTDPEVVYRFHPAVPSADRPAQGGPACVSCGHPEHVHVDSSPFEPWCRLCYAHPFLHFTRNHAFEARSEDR
jgi:hypothetical protein